MTLARRCRVLASGPDGLRLLPEPGVCRGCAGCAGRCALFGATSSELSLPSGCVDFAPAVGDVVEIHVGERRLLAEAARGYGWPLAGLLVGASLGFAAARLAAITADPVTLLGAAAGTLLGLALSNRHPAPAWRVRPVADAG